MSGSGRNPRRVLFRSGLFGLLALLVTVSTLSGCTSVQLRMGTRTQPQEIENLLQFGQSTRHDVKQLFGEPDGTGAYLSPITGRYSTVWSYYFAEGTLELMDDTFLFVYFDNELYEGYLWFENRMQGAAGGQGR